MYTHLLNFLVSVVFSAGIQATELNNQTAYETLCNNSKVSNLLNAPKNWADKNEDIAKAWHHNVYFVGLKCNTPEVEQYADFFYEYHNEFRYFLSLCSTKSNDFSKVDFSLLSSTPETNEKITHTLPFEKMVKTKEQIAAQDDLSKYDVIDGGHVGSPTSSVYMLKPDFIPCSSIIEK